MYIFVCVYTYMLGTFPFRAATWRGRSPHLASTIYLSSITQMAVLSFLLPR